MNKNGIKNSNLMTTKDTVNSKSLSSNHFNKSNVSSVSTGMKNINVNNNNNLKTGNSVKLSVANNSNNNKNISTTNSIINGNNLNSNKTNIFENIDQKSNKNKSISSKTVSGFKLRKDGKGNIIFKGSKMYHMMFNDTLKIKKPLVEIIDVESYKKENINEFLNDDCENYEDPYNNSSSTCFIF